MDDKPIKSPCLCDIPSYDHLWIVFNYFPTLGFYSIHRPSRVICSLVNQLFPIWPLCLLVFYKRCDTHPRFFEIDNLIKSFTLGDRLEELITNALALKY